MRIGSDLKAARGTHPLLACVWLLFSASAFSQPADTYRMYSSDAPPGVIGKRQLKHGRVQAGITQPVRLQAPAGTIISCADAGTFFNGQVAPAEFGLQVGEIYRFKLAEIPRMKRVTLYPSVEMIGHLNPPDGQAREFPIPIVFTIEDLRVAAQGGLVTRVVYVEDPDLALAGYVDDEDQPYFEVARGEDPLHAAEVLGRPVAIVRIGSKTPRDSAPNHTFTFDSPPVQRYASAHPATTHNIIGDLPSRSKANIKRVSHTAPIMASPAHSKASRNAKPIESPAETKPECTNHPLTAEPTMPAESSLAPVVTANDLLTKKGNPATGKSRWTAPVVTLKKLLERSRQ